MYLPRPQNNWEEKTKAFRKNMYRWLKLNWITSRAPTPRLAGGLAFPSLDTSCSHSLLFSTGSAQSIHTLSTVKKQRKVLFLPQRIYFLRPSISSWHLVHVAISRWITVKALHPFYLSYTKENTATFGDSFMKTKLVKTFWIQTSSQNERRKKCPMVISPGFQMTLPEKQLWRRSFSKNIWS